LHLNLFNHGINRQHTWGNYRLPALFSLCYCSHFELFFRLYFALGPQE
jgi:hypothetical protein